VKRLVLLLISAFLLSGCGLDKWGAGASSIEQMQETGRERSEHEVVVGAFDFTESVLLANLYVEALVAHGISARLAGSTGPREFLEPALEQGNVDILPEYLGTAVTFLQRSSSVTPEGAPATHELLTSLFSERGIDVLSYAPAENRNEIVVTRAFAEDNQIRNISDLYPLANRLIFGGPPECEDRPLCLIGLRGLYGLEFKEVRSLDSGGPFTAAALAAGEVDVALLFTTDPAIDVEEFVVLKDDLNLQPPENIVPVVRRAVLRQHDALGGVLDRVSQHLTSKDLRALNRDIAGDVGLASFVTRKWLADEDLI
jgi:osmoprotectant transport system substrate-binding protein